MGDPAKFAAMARENRHFKQAWLAVWEALSQEEKIRALELERDDLIAEAQQAEAAGDKYGPAYWNRRDAATLQKRIDEARTRCPKCAGPTQFAVEHRDGSGRRLFACIDHACGGGVWVAAGTRGEGEG